MKKRFMALLGAVLCIGLFSSAALAHKESDAYLTLHTDKADHHVLNGQWDIALRDLNFAIGIDSNRDGAITWGEVKAHRGAIDRYALSHLVIRGDGLTCAMHPTAQMIDDHTDGAYNVLRFKAVCDKNIPSVLKVDYTLFQDVDPYHRGIVTIHAHGQTSSAVLGPHHPSTSLSLGHPNRWKQFRSFVVDGIWHIWTGLDHLLFVMSLLLPSVLIRRRPPTDNWSGGMPVGSMGLVAAVPRPAGYWEGREKLFPAFIEVVKVISGFTLSHSVTLSLAVLGIVAIPSRLVESGIALSVMIAAANNLYPLVERRLWLVAFAFGFIHGLGFASALAGLSLPPLAMTAALGGFNVGVEIGQEAIVLAIMPIAFLMRNTRFYRVVVLRWGSMIIILMASLWLIQRAAGIEIPWVSALLPK